MKVSGPFLGEFGWEVAMWLPWLRFVMKATRTDRSIVICRKGHSALYHDFDEVIEIEDPGVTKVDCQHAWMHSRKLSEIDYRAMAEKAFKQVENQTYISPLALEVTWPSNGPPRPTRCAYHPHKGISREKKVALHVRSCETKQAERNWDHVDATVVARAIEELGYEVFTIGSISDSAGLKDVRDLRGKSLTYVMEELRTTELILGPSSGPLHLANECGAPALWWSGNLKDVDRYAKFWNPWNLPNRQVAPRWQPGVDSIMRSLKAALGV